MDVPSMGGAVSRRSLLRGIGLVAGASALGLLGGCGRTSGGSAGSTGPVSAGAKGTVRIGASGTDGTITELGGIAQKEGYFERELGKVGFSPSYQGFAQAGPAINEALAAGSIDVAAYADFPAISAFANGTRIRIVANLNSHNPLAAIARKGSGIEGFADLKGKKVIAQFGSVLYLFLLKHLKRVGLSIDDVEIVNATSDGASLLASGQADVFVTGASAAYSYEKQGMGTVLKDGDPVESHLVLVARDEFAKEKQDAVEALLKGLKSAYGLVEKDPDRARADLVTKSLPEDIADKIYTNEMLAGYNPKIDDDMMKSIEDTVSYMFDSKLISKKIGASDLLDTDINSRVLG